MKRVILMMAVAVYAAIGTASAQANLDPKYGDNPQERTENIKLLNYFSDAYKTKAYDDALSILHRLIARAPSASLNMYINGSDIYRIKMSRATTKEQRASYLDSMLYLMDKRIEFFGTHPTRGTAYLLAQKAIMFNEYNQEERGKAFQLFRKALNVGQNEIDPQMSVIFFNALTEEYTLGGITPENYIKDYESLMDLLGNVSVTQEDKSAMEQIERLFATSGAASCDNIEKIFRPRYEAEPDNGVLIKQILNLFMRGKCSSEFQLQIAEKYYKIEPSPELALILGSIYEDRGQAIKAGEFFSIAIAGETNTEKKVSMLLRAANAAISGKEYRMAADYSRQIIAIDPENGYGYLFLAGAYAGGANSCSDFEQKAAYWLVVDVYSQARSKFASEPTQVDNINRMISSYASNFPKVEDTFMRGLEPGQSYMVNCGWVSGRTTVRER